MMPTCLRESQTPYVPPDSAERQLLRQHPRLVFLLQCEQTSIDSLHGGTRGGEEDIERKEGRRSTEGQLSVCALHKWEAYYAEIRAGRHHSWPIQPPAVMRLASNDAMRTMGKGQLR